MSLMKGSSLVIELAAIRDCSGCGGAENHVSSPVDGKRRDITNRKSASNSKAQDKQNPENFPNPIDIVVRVRAS